MSAEVTDINVEAQYQEFLRLINLPEHLMVPEQAVQIKQAFYGGASRLLWLVTQVIGKKPAKEAARDLDLLFKQVELYWKQRIQQPDAN